MLAAAQQVLLKLEPQAADASLRPGPRTLVNLPTILYAGVSQHPIGQQATVLGVPISLKATPHFSWTFGDGSSALTTDDPGKPYSGSGDPSADPSYLMHTWTTTGARTVTLTVTWTGTLTREDTGVTITLNPATKEQALAVDVRQSRSELTGNS